MTALRRPVGRLRRSLGFVPTRRRVRDVSLWMPLSHRLPEYVRKFPGYNANLVEVAVQLTAERGRPLRIVDIGANIGDSAGELLAAVPAEILCVEGDTYWLGYLRRNLGRRRDVHIEPSLLLPQPAHVRPGARRGGTSTFEVTTAADGDQALAVAELPARHSAFASVDLVKSDTDGHDCELMPAAAECWYAEPPVLFFEYDPVLTKRVGEPPAQRVWDRIAEHGYERGLAWDNRGNFLGGFSLTTAAVSGPPSLPADADYWDVAVFHRTDGALAARISAAASARD